MLEIVSIFVNLRISFAVVPYSLTYTVENLQQRLYTFANLVSQQCTPVKSKNCIKFEHLENN